jgi:hypothetical protein
MTCPQRARAALKARQGVRYITLEDLTVMRPGNAWSRCPADGETWAR